MAQAYERGIAQSIGRVRRHDVLGDQQWARPLPAFDLARQLIEQMSAACHCGDLNAFDSQPHRNGATNSHARSGNERGLSDELQIHDLSSKTANLRLINPCVRVQGETDQIPQR